MPTDDAVPIAIWVAGLLVLLGGILVTIARLAVYRHTGEFRMPYRRGVVPLLVGLALVSVSAFMLGVRDGLILLWAGVALLAAVWVVGRYRRR